MSWNRFIISVSGEAVALHNFTNGVGHGRGQARDHNAAAAGRPGGPGAALQLAAPPSGCTRIGNAECRARGAAELKALAIAGRRHSWLRGGVAAAASASGPACSGSPRSLVRCRPPQSRLPWWGRATGSRLSRASLSLRPSRHHSCSATSLASSRRTGGL